jgi:hypothetical protein
MKLSHILLGAISIVLASCGQEPPITPVLPSEARANIHSWNGRDVLVEGWLGECRALNCQIFDELAEARVAAKGNQKTAEWKQAMSKSLSNSKESSFLVELAIGAANFWSAARIECRISSLSQLVWPPSTRKRNRCATYPLLIPTGSRCCPPSE